MFRNPLIVAADTEDPDQAETWAKELASLVSHMKVGLTLFTAAGPLADVTIPLTSGKGYANFLRGLKPIAGKTGTERQ